MKVEYTNKGVIARAETVQDCEILLSFSRKEKRDSGPQKKCEICGDMCKSNAGLSIHKAHKHGIKKGSTPLIEQGE